MTPELLTAAEVRDILKTSPTGFKRMRAAGLFPRAAIDLGTKGRPAWQRWTRDQINGWLAQSGVAVAA